MLGADGWPFTAWLYYTFITGVFFCLAGAVTLVGTTVDEAIAVLIFLTPAVMWLPVTGVLMSIDVWIFERLRRKEMKQMVSEGGTLWPITPMANDLYRGVDDGMGEPAPLSPTERDETIALLTRRVNDLELELQFSKQDALNWSKKYFEADENRLRQMGEPRL